MNSRKLKEIESQLEEIKLKKEHLILEKNTIVNLEPNTNYIIEIKNNLSLTIYAKKETYNSCTIKIEENKEVNLTQYISHEKNSLNIEINLAKNAKLNIAQVIFNNFYLKNIVNLSEKASYELKSAYLNQNCESIIINSANLKEKDSSANLLIKGAAKENSIINCDGIISIHKEAFNSQGHQNIKNIILDSTTKIHSEPILEIHNNQVSCSHGCSTAKIEKEALTYIQSRGLTVEEATKLILEGFFFDAIMLTSTEKIEAEVEKKLLNFFKNKN